MYHRPFRHEHDFQNWQNAYRRAFNAVHDEGEVECRGTWIPPVDIKEGKDGFMLFAELPGVKREDIRLSIRDRILELSGEKKPRTLGDNEQFNRKESRHGTFCRRFYLDTDIDTAGISATFRDGVLELSLPKAESVIPKTIEIKTE